MKAQKDRVGAIIAMRRAALEVVVATSKDDPDLPDGTAEVLLVLVGPGGRRLCHPITSSRVYALIEALALGRVEADKLNGRAIH